LSQLVGPSFLALDQFHGNGRIRPKTILEQDNTPTIVQHFHCVVGPLWCITHARLLSLIERNAQQPCVPAYSQARGLALWARTDAIPGTVAQKVVAADYAGPYFHVCGHARSHVFRRLAVRAAYVMPLVKRLEQIAADAAVPQGALAAIVFALLLTMPLLVYAAALWVAVDLRTALRGKLHGATVPLARPLVKLALFHSRHLSRYKAILVVPRSACDT